MKKIFSIILMFTFMINIQAATAMKNYDETVDATKEYINDFENNSKYIILKQEMNIPFIFKNGKVEYSNVFNGNGGLLNEEEYNIGKGYLYNGLNFWLVSDNSNYKIVGTKSDIENKNKIEKYGIRVTEFVKSTARVTGEGTRLNPWEFAKRQFEVQLKVENGIVDAVNMSEYTMFITEGDTDGTTVTGKERYAYDSVSCTNSQNAEYESGKIKIKKISDNTVCTIKFENPGKTISYKEEEQTYDVKYSGYYEIDAYGAQGASDISGKGGHVYGVVYLEKDTKLLINTGGQNGYNGGGSGYYNGGGATTVNASGEDLMIAAGGGGGKDANAGGNGDSKGGASVGAEAGSDGTNHGGGGSSYNYIYKYNCNDCYTGENTCVGGTISYNCSSCHTGRNTCVSGKEEYNCNDCASTEIVCKEGYDRKCKTCPVKTTKCSDPNYTYSSINGKCVIYNFTVQGHCTCTNGKYNGINNCTYHDCNSNGRTGFKRTSTTLNTYSSISEACTAVGTGNIDFTGTCTHPDAGVAMMDPISNPEKNCNKCGYNDVYNKCKTQEEQCVRKCEERENPCLTGENTCAYGCDKGYASCKTGHNTCEYGCDTSTKEYKSGYGGSNVLSSNLKDSKSESGTNTGNGYVKINFYKER